MPENQPSTQEQTPLAINLRPDITPAAAAEIRTTFPDPNKTGTEIITNNTPEVALDSKDEGHGKSYDAENNGDAKWTVDTSPVPKTPDLQAAGPASPLVKAEIPAPAPDAISSPFNSSVEHPAGDQTPAVEATTAPVTPEITPIRRDVAPPSETKANETPDSDDRDINEILSRVDELSAEVEGQIQANNAEITAHQEGIKELQAKNAELEKRKQQFARVKETERSVLELVWKQARETHAVAPNNVTLISQAPSLQNSSSENTEVPEGA